MSSKFSRLGLNALPVLVMIGLIPFVKNDFYLTAIYILIIGLTLAIKREPKDITILILGFFVMTASEYLFVSTGVETFNRNSLLGMMPLWLPFLWAYGFVAIKRGVEILKLP